MGEKTGVFARFLKDTRYIPIFVGAFALLCFALALQGGI